MRRYRVGDDEASPQLGVLSDDDVGASDEDEEEMDGSSGGGDGASSSAHGGVNQQRRGVARVAQWDVGATWTAVAGDRDEGSSAEAAAALSDDEAAAWALDGDEEAAAVWALAGDEEASADGDKCRVCHDGGFLIECDGCEGCLHFSCAGLDWPPDGDFICNVCMPQAPAAEADAAPTFACCICMEERPLAARVELDGCAHDDSALCSECVFNEMSRNARCPMCRAPVTRVRQRTTGREHAVAADVRRGAVETALDADAA